MMHKPPGMHHPTNIKSTVIQHHDRKTMLIFTQCAQRELLQNSSTLHFHPYIVTDIKLQTGKQKFAKSTKSNLKKYMYVQSVASSLLDT